MSKQSAPPLVNLNLGNGWHTAYHQLYDLDPEAAEDFQFGDMSVWSFVFVQDLLQLKHEGKKLLVDVGWYPEGDKTGSYKLVLLEGNEKEGFNWDNPKIEFQTISLDELKNKIRQITNT